MSAQHLTAQLRPAAEEALRRGMSREKIVRLIQRGEIAGERIGSNWFVRSEPATKDAPRTAA